MQAIMNDANKLAPSVPVLRAEIGDTLVHIHKNSLGQVSQFADKYFSSSSLLCSHLLRKVDRIGRNDVKVAGFDFF